MRIVSNEEIRNLDKTATNDYGYPSIVLMENAGLESSRIIEQKIQEGNFTNEIIIVCGKGKNGGDGLVVARRLISNGHRVRVFLMHSKNEYENESKIHLHILEKNKAKISVIESVSVLKEYFNSSTPPYLVVDAILGTGILRDIEGIYFETIELINQKAKEIISLDIASGVMGDTGKIAGTSINATVTISFGFPRLGHFLLPGAARRGSLLNTDLTFPREWAKQGDKFLCTHKNSAPLLQERDRFGHKNSFGHCLLIGGSPGRLGAIEMASQSCLKMGTGLVTVASWEDSFPTLEVKLSSEIMNLKIIKEGDDFSVPKPGISIFNAIVVGPGLGLRPEGSKLMRRLLTEYNGPMVIDADGLNLIAEHKLSDLISTRKQPTVLTPHPGEMSRLLNISKDEIASNPLKYIHQAVEKTGAIVVLKGATTLVHGTDGITWFNHYPNDGMATAGSGDVLAGMIGGMLGQGMNAIEATRLGVYLHTLSGRFAAAECGHRSMTSKDIIRNIQEAFKDLNHYSDLKVNQSMEIIL